MDNDAWIPEDSRCPNCGLPYDEYGYVGSRPTVTLEGNNYDVVRWEHTWNCDLCSQQTKIYTNEKEEKSTF